MKTQEEIEFDRQMQLLQDEYNSFLVQLHDAENKHPFLQGITTTLNKMEQLRLDFMEKMHG